MAKYKLLIDANQYSYKTVTDTELVDGNGTKEVQDKLLYTIPKGTILEAEPSMFNGGENEDFPNSFQIGLKKDTDKYPIWLGNIRDVKNNAYFKKDLELVSVDSKITLDKNVKVVTNQNSDTKVATPQAPESAIQYYTNPKVLKTLAFSALPIGFVAYYCYHKKFSLLKSAMYVSIPIVAIEILSRLGGSASYHSYWANYLPPSLKKSVEKNH